MFRKVHSRYRERLTGGEVLLLESDFRKIKGGKSHSTTHKEIESHPELVRQALEDPQCVRRDTGYPTRKCYYSREVQNAKNSQKYMKVITDRNKFGETVVINAYFENNFKEGEELIWENHDQ